MKQIKQFYKPEVYYHPSFDGLVEVERNLTEKEVLDALKKAAIWNSTSWERL